MFLYGLWESLPGPFNVTDCDFGGAAPPPCAGLSARALARLPAPVAFQLRAWSLAYPEWEAVLIDRAGLDELLAARFPALAPVLASLPRGVQRSDVARLLLVSAWGGVYADVDTAPAAGGDLRELLNAHAHASALFFEEALLSREQAEAAARAHPVRGGVAEARQRLANYFFAGAAGDPCVAAVLAEVLARIERQPVLSSGDADYEVLYTTGPDALTTAVHGLRGWALDGSDILRSERLVAGSDIETPVRAASRPHRCEVVPRPLDQQYFSHGAMGRWKAQQG